MINWNELHKTEREILSANICYSCITTGKGRKRIVYKNLYFPCLTFGEWVAFSLLDNIKQSYSFCFEMADTEIIPIIDFVYDGEKHNPKLADKCYLQKHNINQADLLTLLGILRNSYCVYKYIDDTDGIVKYIGISNNIERRFGDHKTDKLKGRSWKVEFIDGLTRTDAEILEAHFISYYGTAKYGFNKQKTINGASKYITVPETEWRYYFPAQKHFVLD